MSVTSANPTHLKTFIDGSDTRNGRLGTTLTTVKNKETTVAAACSFQHPSTPSLAALANLRTTWTTNRNFLNTIRDDLIEADCYDANGVATVSNAQVTQSLKDAGLTNAPGVVNVDAVEMYGQPPYSGFKDDPICMANGNFLFRDGDIPVWGIAASLTPIRTYNSLDQRERSFGSGWSSMLDISLEIDERRIMFNNQDGSGTEFRLDNDGEWTIDRRRNLRIAASDDAWVVSEGHQRTWTFDRTGAFISATALAAQIRVVRAAESITFEDETSGRWVRYHLDRATDVVRSVETSDGRTADYRYDPDGHLVGVRRDIGDVTYTVDENGYLESATDADGITFVRNDYDIEGRVLEQSDQHGRETLYEYGSDGVSTVTSNDGAPPNVMVHDRRGRMVAMIDGLGHAMRMAYDDHDNIVQIVDRTGATTRFIYDERGNLLEQIDPDGLREVSTWDDADRMLSMTSRAGHTTYFHYEGDGRDATRVVQADGSEVQFTFEQRSGLPTSVVDADGVSVTLAWNRDGLIEVITDGLGAETRFTYNAEGNPISVEFPENIHHSAALDAAGRMLSLATADGEQTFRYTPAGRMAGGTDETGAAWTNTLDAAGEIIEVEDEVGLVLAFERDNCGQVTATVNAHGAKTSYEYDPVGRMTAVIDALGNSETVDWDPEGRALRRTDAGGFSRSCEMDSMGRRLVDIDEGGARSFRTYHPGGELASVTDPDGNTWAYDVDELGRVVSSTDPLGGTTTYEYTPGGRLAAIRSPLGRTVRRYYDAAGRMVRIVEPDETEVHYERRSDGSISRVLRDGIETSYDYDEEGDLSAIAGPWGSISQQLVNGQIRTLSRDAAAPAVFDHDARGQIRKVIDPAGVVTEFTHDACGHLLAHITNGSSTTLGRDATGRINEVTDPYGFVTSMTRDPRGLVDRIVNPDGLGTARTFGDDGRLHTIEDLDGHPLLTLTRSVGGVVTAASGSGSEMIFERDAIGQVTSLSNDAGTIDYRWDADGCLIGIGDEDHRVDIERGLDGEPTEFVLDGTKRIVVPDDVELERDTEGRVLVDEHGTRFSYDLAGRVASTETPTGRTTYDYNDFGLLSTEHTTDGVRTYTYGLAGELLSRIDEAGGRTDYVYDNEGRRVRQTSSDGSEVMYRWDLFGRLVGIERRDGDETTTHVIERDPLGRAMRIDGVPILWDGGVTNSLYGIGDDRFLNHRGQFIEATADDGQWSRRTGVDPWGFDGGTGLRAGYRGELALDELLLLGDRVYDTEARSFLSRDPSPSEPGQLSFAGVYTYAANDPVNLVDPTGHKPLSDADYNKWKEANTKGFIRKTAEAIAKDPWKYLAKAAIIVGGVVAMAIATAFLGPVGLILVGAAVGATQAGLNGLVDGKPLNEIGRDMLIGGLIGGVTGPLGKFIPSSSATHLGRRVVTNAGIQAAQNYPIAFAEEGLNSYLPGGDGDYDAGAALFNGTVSTLAGTGMAEVHIGRTPAADAPPPVDADPGGVPSANPSATPSATSTTRTLKDLRAVPGIGDTLSRRVLASRNARGGNPLTMDQLLSIRGIGPVRAQAIMDHGAN